MKCFFSFCLGLSIALFTACSSESTKSGAKDTQALPIKNDVFHIYDARALELLDLEAEIETLATGFKWAEGPVWSTTLGCLLFSDIPNHKVHKYCPGDTDADIYLEDSGYSNGLAITENHTLLLMQSRNRMVAKMNPSIENPSARYTPLATHYKGKKLNSPNDLTLHSDGSLYFTDPPYGLKGQLEDPAKELPFQGVYRLSAGGELTLLDESLSFPNGVALSLDERQLFVAVSDYNAPAWYRYDVADSGLLSNKKKILDAQAHVVDGFTTGLPDGLKVHSSGVVFATGPGGVWIYDSDGQVLARVLVPSRPVANIAFDKAEDYIYLTAESHLLRVKIK